MSVHLDTIPDSPPCSCRECVRACEDRPGWATPAEAAALLDAGHFADLMLDYWSGGFGEDGVDVDMVAPAIVGCGGGRTPWWPRGRCALLDGAKCRVHATSKPAECRKAGHGTPDDLHEAVARTWDTDEGRAVVERFEDMRQQRRAS